MEAPRTLGRFEVLGKLGEGGMGVVYRARDPQLGRDVALKVLPEALGDDPERRARLLREARAAAQLNHPNITTIHEVGEAGGRDFVAFELVEGRTLADLLHERELSMAEVLDLALPLADALGYAHERGVVHRDVKPANVMLDERGSPKLLDFGLAKLAAEGGGVDSALDLTQPGAVFGTPNAMSPEQAAGKPVDERSDVFSFGTLLHELAARRSPFARDTLAETVSAVISEPPPDLRALRRDVPAAFARVVERALRKDPAERYPTMAALADDLRALRAASGRRSRVGGLVAVAATVLAAVAIGWAATRGGGDAPERDRRSVAVLPFTTLSADEADRAFAAGVYEDVSHSIGRVADLKVVARNSVAAAVERTEDPAEIGRLLGVASLLEGTVQRAGDAVRINLTLLDAETGETLWADRFDRQFRVADVLAIQGEVAEEVAFALDARLAAEEERRITALPTDDEEAYELYLRAMRSFDEGGGFGGASAAAELLRAALERDPDFARARAGLGVEALLRTWLGEFDEAARAEARENVLQAYAQAPDDGEVLKAMSLLAYQDRDYEGSRRYLDRAAAALPNDPIVVSQRAALERRTGKFERALELYRRQVELDPLAPEAHIDVGVTLAYLGRAEEAEVSLSRAAALAPQWLALPSTRAFARLLLPDDAVDANAVVAEALERRELIDPDERWWLALQTRDASAALAEAETFPERFVTQVVDAPGALRRARTLRLLGRDAEAGAAYAEALAVLGDAPTDDPRTLAARAAVLAGLGRADEAVATGEAALAAMPWERDALVRPVLQTTVADAFVVAGELERAVALYEELLRHPSRHSIHSLARSPLTDPLEDLPSWRALVEREVERERP